MGNQSEKMMVYFDMIRREYNDFQKESMDRDKRKREVMSKLKRR
jgi:hypothetical protein